MWEFNSLVEIRIGAAGCYDTRVLLSTDTEEQSIFLSFRRSPTSEEIVKMSDRYCYMLNNPRPLELTEKY